jgi:hypothetical protein
MILQGFNIGSSSTLSDAMSQIRARVSLSNIPKDTSPANADRIFRFETHDFEAEAASIITEIEPFKRELVWLFRLKEGRKIC